MWFRLHTLVTFYEANLNLKVSGRMYKDYDDMTPEERADFDIWEKAFLDHVRDLIAQDEASDKIRMVDPARMHDITSAYHKLQDVLAEMGSDAQIEYGIEDFSRAGYIRVRFAAPFETVDVRKFTEALADVNNVEFGISFNQVYADLTFYGVVKTQYLD